MINRRLLRIKVLLTLYAYHIRHDESINVSEKELGVSIEKTYDLYYYTFLLLVELSDYFQKKLDIENNKYIKEASSVPLTYKFISNKIISSLRENEHLINKAPHNILSNHHSPQLMKELHSIIIEDETFNEYITSDSFDWKTEKSILVHILKIVMYNESFYQVLEENSIYWNDDPDLMLSMVMKTIKQSTFEDDNVDIRLFSKYKTIEEEAFAKNLLKKTILQFEDNKAFIQNYSKNWDIERIAFLDNLIICQAITELKNFPSIPVKVTLNEYIEISKLFSTPKSSNFINGILDKILAQLKKEKKIIKTGRGLIGEN